MSIIRKGRRKISKLRLILVGLLMLLFLLCAVTLILNWNKNISKKKIVSIPNYQGAIITRDIAKGEVIGKEDLDVVTVSGESNSYNILNIKDAIGARALYSLHANTILCGDMFESRQRVDKDVRKHVFHYIEITNQLKKGDYVDIRIQFPNGADYIVVSKKRVLDCSLHNESLHTDNGIWLEVSEEEILMLSSALIDAYYDENVKIYAIQYVSIEQEKAIVTYPVNDIVHTLLKEDPNIIKKANEEVSKRVRERVTMGLKEYSDRTMNGATKTSQFNQDEYSTESSLPEQQKNTRESDIKDTEEIEIDYID